MRAGTLEDDRVVYQLVDEQPIGFDVAFAPAPVVTDQGMVMLALCQWFFVMSAVNIALSFPVSLPRRRISRRSRSNWVV